MNRKMVLISNCGFPEVAHFDGIRHVFRHMEKSSGAPLVGELLMPAGQLLRVEPLKEKVQVVLQAAHRAGIEVVRDGRVSQETEAQIQIPLLPLTNWPKWPTGSGIASFKRYPRAKNPKGQ